MSAPMVFSLSRLHRISAGWLPPVRFRRCEELWCRCRYGAQRIGHQGPAPRSHLDEARALWAPLIVPGLRHPQPQHLAEGLADFGRGDEIASDGLAHRVGAAFASNWQRFMYCATEIGPWLSIQRAIFVARAFMTSPAPLGLSISDPDEQCAASQWVSTAACPC